MAAVTLKSPEEIQLMRESCRIVADVLRLLKGMVKVGVSTRELDTVAEEYIRSQNAVPAFKGYGHDKRNLYPATLCTSVDDEVVHGIPGTKRLREGEIISIDVGVKKNGFFGDGAWSFPVGAISDNKTRLLEATRESLMRGIKAARAKKHLHDISAAIQKHVEHNGFSVVRDLVGHGIGRELHEEPPVPNYGSEGSGPILQPGMTLAIEPMVNFGTYHVRVDTDGWTVRTADNMPSAHFEHTVLITENEPEILTI
jgi:methionyl aminopeptidase